MRIQLNQQPAEPQKGSAFLTYGFRPFFLLASVFTILHIILWIFIFSGKVAPVKPEIPIIYWHAHEMIFGYSFAIIVGFLLTAVINWTKYPTLSGYPLVVCCLFWLLARLLLVSHAASLWLAMGFDLLFFIIAIIAILIPIYKSQNRRQLGIIVKLFLMFVMNLLFYLSALKVLPMSVMPGVIYFAFYLVISLVLVLSRRVLPFFIGNTILDKTAIKNNDHLDRILLLLFLIFAVFASFFRQQTTAIAITALLLFVGHVVRAYFWYHPSIWKKPLLWSFWGAYCILAFGFLMVFLSVIFSFPMSLAIHTFGFGGIGFVTLSMMSRVSLGHTGRNVNQPSPLVYLIFLFLGIGFLFRVILPIFMPLHYMLFLDIAAFFWLLSFAVFLIVYTKILIF